MVLPKRQNSYTLKLDMEIIRESRRKHEVLFRIDTQKHMKLSDVNHVLIKCSLSYSTKQCSQRYHVPPGSYERVVTALCI